MTKMNKQLEQVFFFFCLNLFDNQISNFFELNWMRKSYQTPTFFFESFLEKSIQKHEVNKTARAKFQARYSEFNW